MNFSDPKNWYKPGTLYIQGKEARIINDIIYVVPSEELYVENYIILTDYLREITCYFNYEDEFETEEMLKRYNLLFRS